MGKSGGPPEPGWPDHTRFGPGVALHVTVDELVGYERLKEAQAPRNPLLWRKLRDIEKLGDADRKAVLSFVDALLAKQRFEHQRG